MDSTGLHAIVGSRERLGDEARRVALVPGPPAVRCFFEVIAAAPRSDFVQPADDILRQALAW